MSKLSQAKTDLNFLKKKITEVSDVINRPFYNSVFDEYCERDLEAMKRCYTYCETYIKLLEIKKQRNQENAERVENP
jgi:hypothetical protein